MRTPVQPPSKSEIDAAKALASALLVEEIGRLTGRVHELTEEVERLRRQLRDLEAR